ncbi:MAG: AtpZ/AtpI family protein [Acidibacillus sp.]|uniref:AtpZ/AtpI family protein n=1 Tax=Sulfoacidibacillus ferrooxidans TaxID=2005001 RepID=UPI001F50B4CF|nr:AtpZ/AtpI family protein [Sulfoacidibacillus ferrooxidans]MCY0892278.1 AtpZ/AtpI family protein [Acidibacillus sp.]
MRNFDKDDKKPTAPFNTWKAVAVFSGASLQLLVTMIVFGFLGHLLAERTGLSWLTAIGVLFGMIVGISGLSFLIKQFLGGKS